MSPDVTTDYGMSPGIAAGIQQDMVKSTNNTLTSASADSNAFVVLQLSEGEG